MEIARGTDLPDLLASLGYTVTRIGRYYSTKEMDSLRIKNRRTWYRYSERVGGMPSPSYSIFAAEVSRRRWRICWHSTAAPGTPPRSGAGKLTQAPEPPKPFALPPRHTDARRVYAYLKKRGGFSPDYSEFYFRRTAV